MNFYDNSGTTENGIVNQIWFRTNTDSNSFPIKQITPAVNLGLDRLNLLAIRSDGRWQYDDLNHSKRPIARTNLVSGQADYKITTDEEGNALLEFVKVLVAEKGNNSLFKELDPTDVNEEYQILRGDSTNVGEPYKYDKQGTVLWLDPVPDYSVTNGLKVYFKRTPHYFTTSDTTATSGFPSFDELLVDYGVLAWYRAKEQDKVTLQKSLIMDGEKEFIKFMSRRNNDKSPRMTFGYVDAR